MDVREELLECVALMSEVVECRRDVFRDVIYPEHESHRCPLPADYSGFSIQYAEDVLSSSSRNIIRLHRVSWHHLHHLFLITDVDF